MKKCRHCNQSKEFNNFYKDKRLKLGIGSWCKDCTKKYNMNWVKNNPAKSKRNKEKASIYKKEWIKNNKNKIISYNLKYDYGITLNDYEVIFSRQNGLCEICKKPETQIDKRTGNIFRLAIDHNHKTGKIRALLCGHCNTGLGKFKDSSLLLIEASNYLIKYNK